MAKDGVGRRTVLQSVAGLAALQAGLAGGRAASAGPSGAGVGDFDFLAGEWRINHRQLKLDGTWDLFKGEATVVRALEGVASIEELRIPERGFSGMGVRVYDVERKAWADHWVNGKVGVVNPPMYGTFAGGVGAFVADETDGDKPVRSRGVWDRITPTSCRWSQSSSTDGGMTWTDSWYMDWVRA